MTEPILGPAGAGRIDPATATKQLRKAAQDFEGIFLGQLFREMRATVPSEDAMPGQEMFTEMLDDTVAQEAARHSPRGLGEALFRQLSTRLGLGDATGTHRGE